MAVLIAQQGSWLYLADAGTGAFQGKKQQMARKYDRQAGTLSEPWPLQAYLARGYWDDVTDLELTQDLVRAEIDKLL